MAEEQMGRDEIMATQQPCSTTLNGTGRPCTCDYDCVNYWLRAHGLADS
jgi:hypothetical protein